MGVHLESTYLKYCNLIGQQRDSNSCRVTVTLNVESRPTLPQAFNNKVKNGVWFELIQYSLLQYVLQLLHVALNSFESGDLERTKAASYSN